ncbi:MAG: UvrD-helicase domain-containing protein [Planctomycetota bacterium]|nr:UvrD-helicase domain-containing protein [Planctomycetota bacterium]
MDGDPLLADLTEPQRLAVEHGDGPLLVLAGPGSGKTRVITRRVAMIMARGVPAWQILALTFTNKAAREMRERVDVLLGAQVISRGGLQVSTFHAWCARILRQYGPASSAAAHVIGPLASGFSILDASDARSSVKSAVIQAGLDVKTFRPAWVQSSISTAKNRLLSAEALEAESTDFASRSLARVYREYEGILARANALDFDDLLMRTAKMLIGDATVRDAIRRRCQHLLVDEYQDTNQAQFTIVRMIAQEHGNVCVVGDPDQSIYGWRGADITNILGFEDTWPGARVIALGENFRSTGHIVACADALIRHNKDRRERPLSSMAGAGELVDRLVALDEKHEAQIVVQMVVDRMAASIPLRDMAVLYRMNALSRSIEEECLRRQIPYVIARGTAFYERAEVRTLLSYLRVLANPADDLALKRASKTPSRGIGDAGFDQLLEFAAARQSCVRTVLPQARAAGAAPRTASACMRFADELDGYTLQLAGRGWNEQGESLLGAFITELIERAGLRQAVAKDAADEEEADDRCANLQEVANAAADVASPVAEDAEADRSLMGALHLFLERVALVADADMVDPERGALTLMTLHAAKGLEFDTVMIIGLEQNILPHSRAAQSEAELEEERRLLYVGITRAKRRLLITSARMRSQHGMRDVAIESDFSDELPIAHLSQRRIVEEKAGRIAQERTLVEDGSEYSAGMMVRHGQFGIGKIESVFLQSGHNAARVNFPGAGAKTLILAYAKLEVVR